MSWFERMKATCSFQSNSLLLDITTGIPSLLFSAQAFYHQTQFTSILNHRLSTVELRSVRAWQQLYQPHSHLHHPPQYTSSALTAPTIFLHIPHDGIQTQSYGFQFHELCFDGLAAVASCVTGISDLHMLAVIFLRLARALCWRSGRCLAGVAFSV